MMIRSDDFLDFISFSFLAEVKHQWSIFYLACFAVIIIALWQKIRMVAPSIRLGMQVITISVAGQFASFCQ